MNRYRHHRGRKWHAWAWKSKGLGMLWFAEANKPRKKCTEDGEWVRVRFVELGTPSGLRGSKT